jgi:flavin-dependent dehydrogenase
MELTDGSNIAVIGGGPAGSFFSYFALEFAKRYDLDISIDIYEAKNFTKIGAGGCNHCGGIISESLVQKLSTDGIIIPANIIRRAINTYTLHVEQGSTVIHTPSDEKRIASVFRGCGPKGCMDNSDGSFDNFLLGLCKENGANIILEKISQVEREADGIIIHSKKYSKKKYDLVVGAVGLNIKTLDIFGSILKGYVPPKVTRTYISEFLLEKNSVDVYFENSMHVFLLNIPNITFGALIPKDNYVTLVLLGKDIDKEIVKNFISTEQVKGCFPKNLKLKDSAPCKCYPYINIKAARNAFSDRVVLIGDSASSKLYKNGIGAAYITGRAAAKTVIFEGISEKKFRKSYQPVCQDLNRDNNVGKFIFSVTKIIQKSKILKTGLLRMIIQEQKKESDKRLMSAVLWDTFTGSEGYRNILFRFLNPSLLITYLWSIISSSLNRKKFISHEKQKARTSV